MTAPSTTAVLLTWGSADGRLLETVRVSSTGQGLRATGHLVRAGIYGAAYSMLVDPDGVVRRMSVQTDSLDGGRSLTLTRNPDGNWVSESPTGSAPMPALADAQDVYLRGSAFAVSLPIRRTGAHRQVGVVSGTAADVHLPSLSVEATVHQGTTTEVTDAGAKIQYAGVFGNRELTVDTDGYLISVEGLIQRLT